MTCANFERWLDDGRPDRDAPRMLAHAATCGLCEGALQAASEVEAALSFVPTDVMPAATSAGFNDSVMRKVHAVALLQEAEKASSWWARALTEPSFVVSIALATGAVWQYRALSALALAFSARVVLWIDGLLGPRNSSPGWEAVANPVAMLGLALAITPPILWISWRFFQVRQSGPL